MNQFAIVTDSASDLPQQMVDELDITVLPLRYMMDGVERCNWPDHRDMSTREFFDLQRKGVRATTSALNAHDYEDALTPILEAGQDVLIIVFSSGLSTTYQSSVIAVEELQEKFPERKICTVDTLCASLGQGLIVWYAAKMRAEGKTMEEIRRWLEDNKLHLCHEFTVDDLNHLKRGGRVSAATALVGTMLAIKPILHVDDEGHLVSVGKTRGRAASLKALVDKMAENAIDPEKQTVFICHGDCEEEAQKVAAMVKERCGVQPLLVGCIGPVIGAHSGAGTMALFYLGRKR